jgi:general secretion pathway protein G
MIGGAGIQYKADSMRVLSSRFSVLGAGRFARCSCQQPTTNNRQLPSRGFTLIEILVVVVILGILAAIVVPRVMEHPGEARQVRAKQDIQAIVTALNTYKLDNYTYPGTEQGLDALVHKPSGAPEAPNWHGYLDKAPKDPWNKPYLYLHPGSHGDIDVFSYGADGKPGGEGEDADVGNWDN